MIALLRSTGLGFLIVALLCAGLAVLRAAGVCAHLTATWSLLPLLFCAGLARINHRLMRDTGARTPWKGSLYAAAAVCAAALMTVFCGCTGSVILTEDEEYAWPTAHVSYNHLVDQCDGERVTLLFRNGSAREGFLVRASRDSIFWWAAPGLDTRGCATGDLACINVPTHVIPEIACTVGGTCVGVVIGGLIAIPQGESGGAHPVSPPVWPVIAGGATGGALGFFAGRDLSIERTYMIDTVSLRHRRAAGGTR